MMFVNVQIDSYFAHLLIFAQPSARKLKVAEIDEIKVSKMYALRV